MTPPADLTSIIIIAGFGIAAGIAVLYNFLTNPDNQEEHNRNHQNHQNRPSPPPPSRRRRSSSPLAYVLRSSAQKSSVRAISPLRAIPSAQPTAVLTSSRGNGVRRRPGEISNCELCKRLMSNLTIELDCRHIFHDECYTIWRYGVVMSNPHAKLCPIC